MEIIEFVCQKCGAHYVGEDENDTVHLMNDDGDDCGGEGILLGIWTDR